MPPDYRHAMRKRSNLLRLSQLAKSIDGPERWLHEIDSGLEWTTEMARYLRGERLSQPAWPPANIALGAIIGLSRLGYRVMAARLEGQALLDTLQLRQMLDQIACALAALEWHYLPPAWPMVIPRMPWHRRRVADTKPDDYTESSPSP